MSQQAFATALLDAFAAPPAGLRSTSPSEVDRRFAVHRNNTIVTLVDALLATYPVVAELVGERFFRAMAAVYVRQSPPRHPVLWCYGLDLDCFIAGFEPAKGLPYLPSVARVEAACARSLNAADDLPIDTAQMEHWFSDTQTLERRGCRFAASLVPLSLDHAGADIWMAHQPDANLSLKSLDTSRAQEVLVYRRDEGAQASVVVWEPPAGSVALVQALKQGRTWLQAAQSVASAEDHFDLVTSLAGLIHHGLIVALPLRPD